MFAQVAKTEKHVIVVRVSGFVNTYQYLGEFL